MNFDSTQNALLIFLDFPWHHKIHGKSVSRSAYMSPLPVRNTSEYQS